MLPVLSIMTTQVCLCMGVWCVSIIAGQHMTTQFCFVCVCVSLLGEHHDNTCLLCVCSFRPGSEVQCEHGISVRQLENFSTIFKMGTRFVQFLQEVICVVRLLT